MIVLVAGVVAEVWPHGNVRVSIVSGQKDVKVNEKQSNHFKKDQSSKAISTLKCSFRLGFFYFISGQYSKQDPLICGNRTDCIQVL